MSAQSELVAAPVASDATDAGEGMSGAMTARVGAAWERVADLLEALVSEYDAQIASSRGAVAPRMSPVLEEVLDGFELLAASARRNSEVLEDLAAEVTIAQARLAVIRGEDAAPRPRLVTAGDLASSRCAREVWRPLDDHVDAARRRLSVVRAD